MNIKTQSPLYHRTATALILRYADIYPAVVINGPRQSGKTTLARTTFPHLPYVSLEDLDTQISFQSDPRGFLINYQNGAIFDEVQHTPTLLSYLQGIIDNSLVNGRFIITGSQNFTLNQNITQSLAGRVGQVTLLPLSYEEFNQKPNINEYIFTGSYPRLHYNHMRPEEFYPAYINTYIERDVRQLRNISNLSTFKTFLKLCAGRIGQELNINDLSRDADIDHKTAIGWLSVLEASYIIFFLNPHHENFNKRLTKMKKLYFYDTGIAASLLNLNSPDDLAVHFARGAFFENLIIIELLKRRFNKGSVAQFSFWRDSAKREIDLIEERAGGYNLIEIKSNHTLKSNHLTNLKALHSLFHNPRLYIVYRAPQANILEKATLLSLETLDKIT